ncbi:alpha/beta fold hydrolase [Aureispira anguillae]|uniref:Alpha/beta hydrolase n=1 Tax=Aureispira anguillae TaxID=2864201 RepID=A0A915YBG5_9BACT|nr:alpha/beta hydrolase [Aureispira anguillae]BDS10007.1 alpha/beta hydrolase [Aureispira anguillae]
MALAKKLLLVVLLAASLYFVFAPKKNNPLSSPSTTNVPSNTKEDHRRAPPPPKKVKKGIQKKRYKDGQVYYIYVPPKLAKNPDLNTQVLAIIHGYTGQTNGKKGQSIALKNMKRFIDYANDYNTLLIAPHFSEKTFDNDYQRLNLDGTRADLRLLDLVQVLKGTFHHLDTNQLSLFGFSGGGQFVHRFCAFHPLRIHKAVVSGSGWYMWPDPTINYPLGTNLKKFTAVDYIDLHLLAKTNIQVLIGEHDTQQGAFRTEYKDININTMQGNSRFLRAQKWVNAMNRYALQNGIDSKITLTVIPDTEHQTSNELIDAAYDFLSTPYE